MIDTILNSFNIWTDAQAIKSKTRVKSVDNISLEGINSLRELILELASRGKLVSQNEKDLPATDILKNISKIKDQLKLNGANRKKNKITKISKEDVPYKLPNSWTWARLPQICDYSPGKTPSTKNPSYWTNKLDGIPWVSISDMSDFGSVNKTKKFVSKEASKNVFSGSPIPAGTILMSFKLTIGKISILTDDAYHNEAIISISPFAGILKEYLFLFLPNRAKKGNSKNALMGNTLNSTSLGLLLIPIPPYQEQKRIVTKVNELMTLCDRLEQEKERNLKTHQILVKTILETLTQAKNADELQIAWERMSIHFDTLFCTEDSIVQLKQIILQLGVMGKLIKQDPNDESSEVLLKKISKKKKRLIEEGRIRKSNALPDFDMNDLPFDIPENWAWVRFGNITSRIGSGSTPRGGKSAYVEMGIPFLRSQNIRNNGLDLNDVAYISAETHEKMLNTKVFPNDILLNITGGSLGRCTIFPEENKEANVSQHVSIIRLINEDFRFYIHSFLQSPRGQQLIWGRQVGANREGLSKKVLELFEIPIPPINEQKRIETKIQELFVICDSISIRLKKSQELKNLLSETIIKEAI